MTTSALLHSFSKASKPESEFINVVRAEGSCLFDDQGKRYIDGMASLWYCQVGHGRREIIDPMLEQLGKFEAYHTFDPFTNGPAAEVSDLIASKSPLPDGRVFLGCSGSEAIDTAMKIAKLVQLRKSGEDRQIIIRRERGYHGTNFGGTTAQGIAPNREGWGDLVPHFVEVDGDDIEDMSRVFAEHGERIAAVVSEPVQGAGGVFPPTDGYLEGVRRLCDQHGALLIFDEVICGFGRTGSWFGSQTFGVTPDLITFAKGVSSGYQPLSGVIVSRGVADELEDPELLLRTGYTYSGHPVACVAGIANINLIEAEGLVDRSMHVGRQLTAGFDALKGDGLLESYRGIGAIWATNIGRDSIPSRDAMLDAGVVLRGVGDSLVFCPPLVITDAEVAEIIEKMADVLSRGI